MGTAGAFDQQQALRAVFSAVERRMGDRGVGDLRRTNELANFVQHVAMVCGWAPAGTGEALLAALADPDGPYRPALARLDALPEIQRQAEVLRSAVTTLDGTVADHDQRIAAAEVATGFLRAGCGYGSVDGAVWWPAVDAMGDRFREILAAQPAAVRQELFDTWTAVEGMLSTTYSTVNRLVGCLLWAGGVDVSGWLDRLGGFLHVRHNQWTGDDLIRTEHLAGRPHPAALATWRRMQFENYSPIPLHERDLGKDLWPIPNIGEQWADRAIADVEAMPAERRSAWQALLAHCVGEKEQARPKPAWRNTARSLLGAVGPDAFAARLDDWLPLVGLARSLPVRARKCSCGCDYVPCPPRMFDRHNVGLLVGLLWIRAMCPPSEVMTRSLGQIAERASHKIPGLGAASQKLAYQAAGLLIASDHPGAVAQLARLASRLTYKGTLRIVEKGLAERAAALGIGRDDVEEMALPGFGLPLADKLGDCSYEVEVRGVDAAVVWRNPAGKVVKAPPAQVRQDHAEELKDLKATVRDIAATLIAIRDRLEGLLRRDRQWTVGQWRERFLDHPLARTLARRLIWAVDGVPCCWAGDALRTVDDSVLAPAAGATVRLWHPVDDPSAVAGWRAFLSRHEITQPFKQAHREQYLLTDAERATGTYSNRFAGHIVRQYRLNALLSRRGWSYVQQRDDGAYYRSPGLDLPDWGLSAGLGTAGIEVGDDLAVFDTLATDQLVFCREGGPPATLEEVPPVVLSEVMRDVDLFVAVAGVGSDPNWYDGGPDGRHRDYWARNSFGALTPPGETRREVLAELIPRLAIADRCTLTERFLEVRGDLHTYRIHCGSGNILIAPHDRYLCVIPGSAKAKEPEMFLPFDGDTRLSEIISKALLLAADKKIKDPVILRQL